MLHMKIKLKDIIDISAYTLCNNLYAVYGVKLLLVYGIKSCGDWRRPIPASIFFRFFAENIFKSFTFSLDIHCFL